MVKSIDSNQIQKIDRPYIQPIYLIHLLLDGLTLYFSDRNLFYNNYNYEGYLFDLSGIGNQIGNLGGYDNTQVTLKFRNDRIRTKNYLIEIFDDYPSEKKYVEIYKLLIDTGESFGSDVSTKIFKGEMGQHYDIDELEFKIDCSSMLFGKNNALPLDVIDLADFPKADPDDVGKYRNIIYGAVNKVVCPWTLAGWASTLVLDIDDDDTSVEVSDEASSPAVPFTAMCEAEEIRVTGKTGNTFTVTRGYNSTTAVAHNAGTSIYEKRSDFEAEVACHPVKSIGDIFVLRQGEWVRVTSGVTAYENVSGRAILVFIDKPKFEQTINITAETDVDTGSHGHGLAESYPKKECIPTGSSGPTGHANVRDGNQDSYCGIGHDEAVAASFTEDNLGTISYQYLRIYKLDTAESGYVQCPSGTNIGILGAAAGWYRLVKSGGNWTDGVVVVGGPSGNQIGEIYKEVQYEPPNWTNDNPATGVTVDVTLSGNSAANLLIGDAVACNVEGYADPDGNYGGIGTLIERPDWVRKHILIELLGLSAADIHSSFGTVGAIYADRITGGYKLAFVLHEVATEAMKLFKEIDLATRSHMQESQGIFKLFFCSSDEPTSQLTFDENNIKGRFKFSKTESADIRNRIRAHFDRDYTKSGDLGTRYQNVVEMPDEESITKYGENQIDIELGCVINSDMAYDVVSWILSESSEPKRIVEFDAFWDAMILEGCDYFTVLSNFWSGYKYKTLAPIEDPKTQVIKMKGIQFRSESGFATIFKGIPAPGYVETLGILGSDVYAGVGSAGVYRYDGGSRWTQIDAPAGLNPRSFLEFDGSLYCGTYGTVAGDGKIYKLVAGSWSQIGSSPGDNKAIYSMVEFDGTIYVGTWPSGIVYKLEAGPTWTSVGQLGASTSILSLVVLSEILYGASVLGHVFRYDGGTTWIQIGTAKGERLAVHDGGLYGTFYSSGVGNYVYQYVSGTTWDLIGGFTTGSFKKSEICSFGGELYVGISLSTGPGSVNLYQYSGTPDSWDLMTTIPGTDLYSILVTASAIWLGLGDGRVFCYD